MEGEWKFRPMGKGEKLVDPVQSQFFTTNIVGGLTAALVRETIQNSLDANLNLTDEPVKVRFRFSTGIDSVPADNLHPYIKSILPHLTSEGNGLFKSDIPDFSKPAPFLLIEDFCTKGLEGDPGEIEDPDPEDGMPHNFYWFWRNVGRSGKGNDDRGRWGLGKTVFPAASRINTFFGLTVRSQDNQQMLMGQAVLKIHKIQGQEKRYCPYGDFGHFDDEESQYFANPITSGEEITKFEKTFGIERQVFGEKSKTGLSVVIPFPAKEITRADLVKAVLKQYFYPIIAEKLEVIIEEDNLPPIRIDSTKIDDVIQEVKFSSEEFLTRENLKSLFQFSRSAINFHEEDYIVLQSPPLTKSVMWKMDWFLNESLEKLIEEKIENFEKGEQIGFKVPVKVHVSDSSPVIAWFKVYFENDESLNDADVHFVRDGITITGINPLRRKNIRALVVIDNKPLVQLLGDAENPAHTEWQKDSPHFKGKYINGDSVISFVIKAVEKLHNLLIKPSKGIDEDILKDIFYIENDKDNQDSGKKPEEKPGGSADKPEIDIEAKLQPILVNKINKGVNIKLNQKLEELPKNLSLSLAYDVIRGNPIKKYNPLDFDLADNSFIIKCENGKILTRKQNRLVFQIDSIDFSLSLKGFDSERDLVVKTDEND